MGVDIDGANPAAVEEVPAHLCHALADFCYASSQHMGFATRPLNVKMRALVPNRRFCCFCGVEILISEVQPVATVL